MKRKKINEKNCKNSCILFSFNNNRIGDKLGNLCPHHRKSSWESCPPFRIIEQGQFSGIYFDIVKEIGQRLSIDIQFKEEPFKRALHSMKVGKADIMCGPNRTEEREAYMIYLNTPLARAHKAFYVHPDSPEVSGYDDLKHLLIGIHRGKLYFEPFDNDGALKKEAVNTYEQAIKKVHAKRNDVVIMPEQEGDYLLKQLGIKLKKSSYIVEGKISYITISKKSSAFETQSVFEEVMAQMEKEGKMQEILNRYK